MHMNDLTLDELKRKHEELELAIKQFKSRGLPLTAGYLSLETEKLQARINELEAAAKTELEKDTP